MGHCKAGHRRLVNENSGSFFFDLNLILSSCNSAAFLIARIVYEFIGGDAPFVMDD